MANGTAGAARAIERFDTWVAARVEPYRGRPWADTAAAAASTLGDRGLVWFLVLLARSARPGRRRRLAARAVAFTGVVVPLVNASLKALVGRDRPEVAASVPGVRAPHTASFPSGHSLAAWSAATLLADGDPAAPAYYAVAGAVSLSRVHVRHHHATDVVAGALIGLGLGRLGRRVLPLTR
jgi:undecaprenyl-diphosphatase